MSRDTFEAVRLKALVSLRDVAFDNEHRPVFCRWQVAGEVDVAAYCNVNTYLETLDDLLANGLWVDNVSMDDVLVGTLDTPERLFRFYGLALLVVGEILSDLRLMHQNAETGGRLGPDAGRLMGFINEIWKHRDGSRNKKSGRVFHRDLHHGPYYFTDALGDVDEQTAATLLSVDSLDMGPADMAGVLVPSLVSAIKIVGDEIQKVGGFLDDPRCQQRLESRWGISPVGADQ